MLENIHSPAELKLLSNDELKGLAAELREKIIKTVSINGGHLASNLGMVEASIVIHKLFDCPKDKIIFDVGHQCYAHKLLTGRAQRFSTLRKKDGISGFTNPSESDYDEFYAGHCGPSISEAIGLAKANKLCGSNAYTLAIVGDGAFTNGMIYEALNNLTDENLRLIVILNDNEMSISKNVGIFSTSLTELRTSQSYFSFKRKLKRDLLRIPLIGKNLNNFASKTRDLFRRMLVKDNLFEILNIDYLGPVDGNDIEKLSVVLNEAKAKNRVCIVHMITKKGLGYSFAEEKPEQYHSTGAFDPAVGIVKSEKPTFSSEFGRLLTERAAQDKRLCAITAAMCEGTGLAEFSQAYPERFFDVGIAEEHAVAFSCGLAKGGMLPVCAIYSTFMQRCFDQMFHDVALQNARVVFALDRSGLVEGDGVTHQGIYDVGLFSAIPGISIYSPETFEEMRACFDSALGTQGPSIVRYPKGVQTEYDRSAFLGESDNIYSLELGTQGEWLCLITYGRVTANVYSAAVKLSEKYRVKLIKLVKVFPLNYELLFSMCEGAKLIYSVEEGTTSGSVSEKIGAALTQSTLCPKPRYVYTAIPDAFIPHGNLIELYDYCALSVESIYKKADEYMQKADLR